MRVYRLVTRMQIHEGAYIVLHIHSTYPSSWRRVLNWTFEHMKFQFLSLTFFVIPVFCCFSIFSFSILRQFKLGDGENGARWVCGIALSFDRRRTHKYLMSDSQPHHRRANFRLRMNGKGKRKWKIFEKKNREKEMTSHISFHSLQQSIIASESRQATWKWKGAANSVMQIYENYAAWMNSFLCLFFLHFIRTLHSPPHFVFRIFQFFLCVRSHWRIADAAVGKTFMDHEKSCLSLIHSRVLRTDGANGPSNGTERKETHFGFAFVWMCIRRRRLSLIATNNKNEYFLGQRTLLFALGFSFLDLVCRIYEDCVACSCICFYFFALRLGFSSLALEVVAWTTGGPDSK